MIERDHDRVIEHSSSGWTPCLSDLYPFSLGCHEVGCTVSATDCLVRLVSSVGSIVTFQETIDFDRFWRQTSRFRFRFLLAPIISGGRMYHRRIDVAMFVLSIGTISAGHNGQLRQRGSA